MSARVSQVTLVGNIGAVPEFKNKENQVPFCVFTLAVDRPKPKAADAKQPEPLWYRVSLWGSQAETAVKLSFKGMPVYVQGRLDVNEWKDRNGRDRYTLEVAGTDFQMLGESPTTQADKVDQAIQKDRQQRSSGGSATATTSGAGNGLGSGY